MSTNITTTSPTTTFSIRVNANTKRIFDKVCERIGITPSAAYNIFTNAVAAQQRIPFEVTANPYNTPHTASATPLDELRAKLAEQGLLRDYTKDEINTLVDEARHYQYTPQELAEQEAMLNEIFNI